MGGCKVEKFMNLLSRWQPYVGLAPYEACSKSCLSCGVLLDQSAGYTVPRSLVKHTVQTL